MSHFETIQILKKSIKLFTLCIVFNLSSLAFAQTPQALQTENLETYPKEVLDAEASIWEIHNFSFHGSGFFISSKLFVTNLHVLSSLLKHEENPDDIHLNQKGNSNTLTIKQVVSISAPYDLAIIEIKETSQHYLNLSETELLKTDEDLFAIGYPDGVFTRIKKTGRINQEHDYIFSFPVNHSDLYGASGSPALNDQGQVVGVLFKAAKNLVFVIKNKSLKNLITGNIGKSCEAISFKNCLDKEIENLKILAKQGSPIAQYELAWNYRYERGVIQNDKLALHWFQKAAEQDYAIAQVSLGHMYNSGEGVIQNHKLALHWYQKAARQGDIQAQYYVGYMHYNGKGIPQNYELAFLWFQKAAQQGATPAQNILATMYYNGEGVAQNYEKAFVWFQKAALQGDVKAQYYLAIMFAKGEGVAQNYEKAFVWFQRAALQGYVVAQYNLAIMFAKGEGVTQDFEQAFYWYQQAAIEGVADAQYNLAIMFTKGEGVTKNHKLAFLWFQRAANQGHRKAKDKIAKIKPQDYKP